VSIGSLIGSSHGIASGIMSLDTGEKGSPKSNVFIEPSKLST
jgi:hypothetical protein